MEQTSRTVPSAAACHGKMGKASGKRPLCADIVDLVAARSRVRPWGDDFRSADLRPDPDGLYDGVPGTPQGQLHAAAWPWLGIARSFASFLRF